MSWQKHEGAEAKSNNADDQSSDIDSKRGGFEFENAGKGAAVEEGDGEEYKVAFSGESILWSPSVLGIPLKRDRNSWGTYTFEGVGL